MFAMLATTLLVPFGGMTNALADNADIISEQIVSESKKQPKMLTPTERDTIIPKFLELEKRHYDLTSKDNLSSSELVTKQNLEDEMTVILERMHEHKQASLIATHIPEKQKLQMEYVVQEIIDSSIPWTMVGVDVNTKSVRVEIKSDAESLDSYKTQIQEFASFDVPITVLSGDYIKDTTCTAQTGVVCDPVVAGIEAEWGNLLCTLALEVKDGWWSWADPGWLTAGHCFPLGSVGVDQPAGNNDIGDVAKQDFVHNGDCDCEWIEKTTTRSSGSKVWLSSNTYRDITSKGDASVNDVVLVSWATTSGTDTGTVVLTEQTVQNQDGVITTGMTIVNGMNSQNGDSGAPIIQSTGTQFHGILKGDAGTDPNTGEPRIAFSPWSNIQPSLSVY